MQVFLINLQVFLIDLWKRLFSVYGAPINTPPIFGKGEEGAIG